MKTLEDYAIAAMPALIADRRSMTNEKLAEDSFDIAESMQKEARRRKIEQQKEENK